jgi:predicted O-methyltransferase YrrM
MQSEELFQEVLRPENFQAVQKIINTMTPDLVIGPELMNLLNNGQAETRSFVYWAAKKIHPKNYLEIGTRRGWSLGMVCATVPECEIYSFDMWQYDYAGIANPGPDFVGNEMRKLGYQKEIHFISGDSHKTIPEFFQKNPTMQFDLILVDGDHSREGAIDDLVNVIPHLSPGGILLFDDIVLAGLKEVFDGMRSIFPDLEYHNYEKNMPGVGIAIKSK